ncbi:hypothetical protein V9T40_009680 [Parthenolecanium corni]|uniref:Longin domain-containing protein n=1 Tax=Parthenolecanium corni TaxID=536013 RepID=A0AAN9Y8E9_9HEMI
MHLNPCLQNIIYTLIIRTKDGMPLSATTDFTDEINKNVKECKRYVKLISKKAQNFPERCVLQLPSHSVYFISYLGVTYLTLCASSYPTVLAFSFLNELMKEFITLYNKNKIFDVVRPYSFLEFDNFIHKTCQRYNKPQNLTTRINLSELSLEMKLRPPYVIKLEELEPAKNGFAQDTKLPFIISHKLQFEDLTFASFASLSLAICLSSVSFFRGISTLCEHSDEKFAHEIIIHGILFLIDASLRLFQIYLLLRQVKHRKLKSWFTVIVLCYVSWCVLWLRDDWQNVIFILSFVFMHFGILFRRIQSKLPDYQV